LGLVRIDTLKYIIAK